MIYQQQDKKQRLRMALNNPQNDGLTVLQLAEIVGVDQTTVKRYITAGKVKVRDYWVGQVKPPKPQRIAEMEYMTANEFELMNGWIPPREQSC